MFPLDESSSSMAGAPILTQDEILRLPTDSLLRCLDTMKSFFEYKHHSRTWTQHNDLRVSRILKCLILKGLHAEARDFYGFVSTLRGDHSSSIEHWQLAMRDALPRASQAVASAQKEGEGSGTCLGQCLL